ncbi:MAG: ProQ/FinO family protein [Gammaproteobacteria bacterium]|nr:ProQ/FinO family protein [Gammaproteobacteria bacterium]
MRKQVLHPRTAVINQKQKNQSVQCRLDALHWLQATFPAAFDNRHKIQPLNVGIMKDILSHADQAAAAGISKSKLREAVVLFTRRLDYLACLKAREPRIDLLGNPSDTVSTEDAENAALKMKKRVEKSLKNARKHSAFAETNARMKVPEVKQQQPVMERMAVHHAAIPVDTQMPRAAAPVVVTRKPSRQYDPAAVARLKEKLGLSQAQKFETEEA